MKILGLIPARGGSKGIPQKNVRKLAGKELIRYSIETALTCAAIDRLIVSTDDPHIAEISRKAGAAIPFLRPAELATDQSPTIDTVIHAVNFFRNQDQHFDAVCLLQATCPFRTAADIEGAIATFVQRGADSLISVREVPHQYNPHWLFEPTEDPAFLKIATGEADIISRRQDLPQAFHRDGSIYLTQTDVLLEQRSLFGQKIAYWISENPAHVNIDTQEDWEKAERWLNR